MESELTTIRSGVYVLLLIVVGAATYANSLDAPLIYDDQPAIVENEYIQSLWPPWRILLAPPSGPTEGRPVVSLSLALNFAVGGSANVRGYHAVNVAIHIACALLLFGLVRRTLLSEKLRDRFGRAADGLAFAAALLWMVHPLVTECVVYTAQRTESLMALFYLLTLYCAMRAIDSSHRGWWSVAAVAACALGMASKEVMVTAPVIVLLYDLAFQSGAAGAIFRRRWPLYAGLACTWIVLATLMVAFPHEGSVGFAHGVSAWEYLKNQGMVIVRYVQLAFWPHPLLIDYGYPQPVPFAQAAPSMALVLALVAATLIALVYRPMLGFLGAWFFIILAPTSSFVPVVTEVGAERRMYLPLAGLIVLVVIAGYGLLERMAALLAPSDRASSWPHESRSIRAAAGVGVVFLAAGLIYLTVRRNAEYNDPGSLWQAAAIAVPENYRAHNNVGVERQSRDELEQAAASYRRALELKPEYFDAQRNLAGVLVTQGQPEQAAEHYRNALQIHPLASREHYNLATLYVSLQRPEEAEVHFEKAIHLDAHFAEAHYNLGNLLVSKGELDRAVTHFRQALEIDPDYGEAHNNLAGAYFTQGNPRQAIEHFRHALRLDPENAKACFNLAVLTTESGDLAGAKALYERVLEIDPRFADAHNNLGALLEREGKTAAAVGHFRQAVELQPSLLKTAYRITWILAASSDAEIRNGQEAVRFGEHTDRATGHQEPVILDALAAAYAEANRFPEAVATAKRAIQQARAKKQDDLADKIELRLGLYEKGQPYRKSE